MRNRAQSVVLYGCLIAALGLSAAEAQVPAQAPAELQLEVVIRPDALDVGDRVGGLIEHIPNQASGPDVAALGRLVQQIKARFPDKTDATVLALPDTPYDQLVKVMDALRAGHVVKGGAMAHGELFPNISIGDAPVARR
mgnify:CR=1 FL=1